MKLILAGFNLDVETLKELNGGKLNHETMTPETISAAYARISRSPKPVNELREMSRHEVEKSRKSNKNIIFAMGHHSVAEHAVFNFDVIGVSRLAIEEIEKFRLCSYTEKSQRYITLEGEFIVPEEIKGTPFQDKFITAAKAQNKVYNELFEKLKDHVFKKNPALAADPKNNSLLEGWAKEDARYITPLANTGQLGQTINARNLELLLRRFASSRLAEVRELGKKYYELVEKIAPSIILFHDANDFDRDTYAELREAATPLVRAEKKPVLPVKLVGHTPDADNILVASLLHSGSSADFESCVKAVSKMNENQKLDIVKKACSRMEFFDSTLREFEHVVFTFELVVSAACFGQLKRHRMSTITVQPYDPELGLTIPDSVRETGMEAAFTAAAGIGEKLFAEIGQKIPAAAPYVLTNAHRRRVLFTVNARELYHVSRLREDPHAQWDIRNISALMSEEAQKAAPLSMLLICGKHKYAGLFEKVFGKPPKVTPPVPVGH